MQSADPNDGKTGLSDQNKVDLAILAFTLLQPPFMV